MFNARWCHHFVKCANYWIQLYGNLLTHYASVEYIFTMLLQYLFLNDDIIVNSFDNYINENIL